MRNAATYQMSHSIDEVVTDGQCHAEFGNCNGGGAECHRMHRIDYKWEAG